MKVSFVNAAGVTRRVKVGFSWTCLFFGGMPFFFRGMPFHGVIFVLMNLITFGLSSVVLAFIANKMSATYYLEHGYLPNLRENGWDYAAAKWGIQAPQSLAKF